MLPLPQDRVFRNSVAVRVFDANEMKKSAVLAGKRLNRETTKMWGLLVG
jgi:hypothetical protein